YLIMVPAIPINQNKTKIIQIRTKIKTILKLISHSNVLSKICSGMNCSILKKPNPKIANMTPALPEVEPDRNKRLNVICSDGAISADPTSISSSCVTTCSSYD